MEAEPSAKPAFETGLIARASRWIKRVGTIPHLAEWEHATPEAEAAFLKFRVELTNDLTWVVILGILAFITLWWPMDGLVAPDDAYVRVFTRLRAFAFSETLLISALLWGSAWVRKRILFFAPLLYSIIILTLSYGLGELGEDGIIWFADANVSMITVILLPVAALARAVALVWIALCFYAGFFVFHPENLANRFAPSQASFLAFTTAYSFAMGEAFYRMVRRGFFQAHAVQVAREEVTALNASLTSRVDAQTHELRTLAVHLERAQETERRRLSRDLHDELGQDLTAMRYTLALLDQRYASQPTAIRPLLAQLGSLLQRTTFTTRNIMGGLRPRVLDDLGLEAATAWLAGQITASSAVPCELDVEPHLDAFVGRDTRVALFRLIQEATTNALKHGSPSRLAISLRRSAEWIDVTVRDDGVGFDVAAAHSGFGLIGMRERVRAVGGALSITSARGEGTVVAVRVRVEDPSEDSASFEASVATRGSRGGVE